MSFGLYLHFPFCPSKCSYCDYYKELYNTRLEKTFFDALSIETELAAEEYAPLDNVISTIYIGGGTPSIVNLDLFSSWLDQLKSVFYVSPDVEFSFETNPETVTPERLSRLMEMGVNRPIFGIQSFQSAQLQLLDRRHILADCHRAIYLANALQFDNYGVDLLFGLPHQSSEAFSSDLDQAIDLDPPHISLYQLTIESDTVLKRRLASGAVQMPAPDFVNGLYRGGCERLSEAGYERYEITSFARPGFECRHNLGYWEGNEYLGLGASAHSYMHGRRFANCSDVNEYNKVLLSGRRPLVVDESGFESRMTEAILMGLRTAKGIDRKHFEERFGVALENRLERKQYDILIESGHLIPDKGWLRLSEEGIYLADEIIRRLVKL